MRYGVNLSATAAARRKDVMLFLASADSDGIVAKQQNSDIVVVFTGVFYILVLLSMHLLIFL